MSAQPIDVQQLSRRAHRAIPAGCHTYSKGDDQFPHNAPAFLVSGSGCRVRDPDGGEWLDWGMGLRSVLLGHGYQPVVAAAQAQLGAGVNFTRPSPLEVETAERLIEMVPCADMVKFAKNGSDVTTAAVRLARAATGRPLIAFPREHPFYSFDDWFIGSTVVDAGVPEPTKRLSLRFPYGDLDAVSALFAEHPGQIAAVITEVATDRHPPDGYLEALRELTRREGAVLIFDEMITGFRWHPGGAQSYYGVTPDLATFGKALANGFSVAALTGDRSILELGGLHHEAPRVFLLSATNGGETHALAAACASLDALADGAVTRHVWEIGQRLQDALRDAASDAGVATVVAVGGLPCSPLISFRGGSPRRDAELRTLFLQETCARHVLIPYIAPSLAHGEAEVAETAAAARAAFDSLRELCDGRPAASLIHGPLVKPVFRRYNEIEYAA